MLCICLWLFEGVGVRASTPFFWDLGDVCFPVSIPPYESLHRYCSQSIVVLAQLAFLSAARQEGWGLALQTCVGGREMLGVLPGLGTAAHCCRFGGWALIIESAGCVGALPSGFAAMCMLRATEHEMGWRVGVRRCWVPRLTWLVVRESQCHGNR